MVMILSHHIEPYALHQPAWTLYSIRLTKLAFVIYIANFMDKIDALQLPGSKYHAVFIFVIASFGLLIIKYNAIRSYIIRHAYEPLVNDDGLVDSFNPGLEIGQDLPRAWQGRQV